MVALPALTPLAPDVWLATDPVRIVGMKLTTTMTVVVLPGSKLLLFSPVAMTPARRAAVEALGTVAHVYAPNTFHHFFAGEWSAAFPDACVHGPAGLRTKRPDLRIDRVPGEDPGALASDFDELRISGFALDETVLVHRASGTLLCADLVHNVGRPAHWWAALYTRAMGFHDRVALSRVLRWTAFRDHAAARASVDRLAACAFDRVVVGHGAPIERSGRDAILAAYTWLRGDRAPLLSAGTPEPRRGFCG